MIGPSWGSSVSSVGDEAICPALVGDDTQPELGPAMMVRTSCFPAQLCTQVLSKRTWPIGHWPLGLQKVPWHKGTVSCTALTIEVIAHAEAVVELDTHRILANETHHHCNTKNVSFTHKQVARTEKETHRHERRSRCQVRPGSESHATQ